MRTIKSIITVGLLATLMFVGCTGKKPQADWTAEEYFHYALEKYEDENYLEAVNDLTVVVLRFAGSSVADSAQFYLGNCHFKMDEFIISAAEYSKLLTDMAQSPLVEEAQYMLAESYYQMSPRAELDQEYTLKSIKQFQIFLEDFPTSKRKEEVEKKILELRTKLAEKQWRNAEIYRVMRRFKSAIIYYDIVLNSFYDSEFAEKALYGKALTYFDSEDWAAAKETCLIFLNKYPKSEYVAEIKKDLDIASKNAEEEVQASKQ